jgi:hypothetical protein
MIVSKCGRGEDTAETNVGNLKVNVRGFEWDMKLIYRGNNYMLVSNIYLKGLRRFAEQVPAHMKTKYPT